MASDIVDEDRIEDHLILLPPAQWGWYYFQ